MSSSIERQLAKNQITVSKLDSSLFAAPVPLSPSVLHDEAMRRQSQVVFSKRERYDIKRGVIGEISQMIFTYLVKNKEKSANSNLPGAKGRPYSRVRPTLAGWGSEEGPRLGVVVEEMQEKPQSKKASEQKVVQHHNLSKADGEMFESLEIDQIFKFLYNVLILGQRKRENIP